MPLTFDISKVPNYYTNFPDRKEGTEEYWNPITEILVFFMMIAGSLTAENFDEFWLRVNIWQHTVNPFLQSGNGPVYITQEQVRNLIGIKTNCSSVTKTKFNAALVNALRRDYKHDIGEKVKP